jgi:hypothetical protein
MVSGAGLGGVTNLWVTLRSRLVILPAIMARLDTLTSDLRFALRHWCRRPLFASIAVATLALGVGAPTAMFSVLHAVLLRPLSYDQPERIVSFRMEGNGPRVANTGGAAVRVPPVNVGALGVVAALLAAVGLAAVLIPAYRATRVNTVDVLRAE